MILDVDFSSKLADAMYIVEKDLDLDAPQNFCTIRIPQLAPAGEVMVDF